MSRLTKDLMHRHLSPRHTKAFTDAGLERIYAGITGNRPLNSTALLKLAQAGTFIANARPDLRETLLGPQRVIAKRLKDAGVQPIAFTRILIDYTRPPSIAITSVLEAVANDEILVGEAPPDKPHPQRVTKDTTVLDAYRFVIGQVLAEKQISDRSAGGETEKERYNRLSRLERFPPEVVVDAIEALISDPTANPDQIRRSFETWAYLSFRYRPNDSFLREQADAIPLRQEAQRRLLERVQQPSEEFCKRLVQAFVFSPLGMPDEELLSKIVATSIFSLSQSRDYDGLQTTLKGLGISLNDWKMHMVKEELGNQAVPDALQRTIRESAHVRGIYDPIGTFARRLKQNFELGEPTEFVVFWGPATGRGSLTTDADRATLESFAGLFPNGRFKVILADTHGKLNAESAARHARAALNEKMKETQNKIDSLTRKMTNPKALEAEKAIFADLESRFNAISGQLEADRLEMNINLSSIEKLAKSLGIETVRLSQLYREHGLE
ncbi:MAG: hypothetical protein WCP97_03805, partial [bacterium]